MFVFIIVYLLLCFVIGSAGKDKEIGFWGAFIISLFLSPVIGLIVMLLSKNIKKEKYRNEAMAIQKKQTQVLESIKDGKKDFLSEELIKLNDLHCNGVLTDDEFQRAKNKLLN